MVAMVLGMVAMVLGRLGISPDLGIRQLLWLLDVVLVLMDVTIIPTLCDRHGPWYARKTNTSLEQTATRFGFSMLFNAMDVAQICPALAHLVINWQYINIPINKTQAKETPLGKDNLQPGSSAETPASIGGCRFLVCLGSFRWLGCCVTLSIHLGWLPCSVQVYGKSI